MFTNYGGPSVMFSSCRQTDGDYRYAIVPWVGISKSLEDDKGISTCISMVVAEADIASAFINSVGSSHPIQHRCQTVRKSPPSNTLRVQKRNPIRSDQSDFASMETCEEAGRTHRYCLPLRHVYKGEKFRYTSK